MADYYQTITLLTKIPINLINEIEMELLSAFEFNWEDSEGSRYFFSDENLEGELSIESVPQYMESLSNLYPKDGFRPKWVSTLEQALEGISVDDAGTDLDLDETGISWTEVFQGILNKPENTGSNSLVSIEAQGGYWCSRDRMGAFGGWCVRVTKNNILSADVADLMSAMRRGIDITSHLGFSKEHVARA